MKTLNLLCSLTIALLAFSCGKQSKPTTKTSFSILTGNLVSGVAQTGGIMVYGHNLGNNDDLAIGLTGGVSEANLSPGNWEFFAIGWEGGLGYMTGAPRCGYIIKSVLAAQEQVSFTLTKEACSQNFGIENYRVSDTNYFDNAFTPPIFRTLEFRSCMDISTVTPSGTDCTPGVNNGLAQSIIVELTGYNSHTGSAPSLTSGCIELANFDTSMRLPVGDTGDGFTYTVIHSFTEASCQGNAIHYHFQNGLLNGIISGSLLSQIDSTITTSKTILFVEHNPSTVNDFGIGTFLFGFGYQGDLAFSPTIATGTDYDLISNVSGPNNRILTVTNSANFSPYEEIIWYVNHDATSVNCGDLDRGVYGFATIASIPNGTTLVLAKPFNEYKSSSSGTFNFTLPTNYATCTIQISRVHHYNNLTVGATDLTIPPFTSNMGGILALKVRGTLTFGGAFNINATGKGPIAASVSYPACPSGFDCAQMGKGDGTYPGGGIALVWAKNISLSANANIQADGDSSGTTEGGTVQLTTHTINNGGNVFSIQTNGTGASGGTTDVSYCSSTGGGSIPVTASGTPSGTANTNINPYYCSL